MILHSIFLTKTPKVFNFVCFDLTVFDVTCEMKKYVVFTLLCFFGGVFFFLKFIRKCECCKMLKICNDNACPTHLTALPFPDCSVPKKLNKGV